MGRKDKGDRDENAPTEALGDGVESAWAEQNSSGSTASSKRDEGQPSSPEAEAKVLNLPKSAPPVTLAPSDRREEQAIRNMTPLGASHAIKPTSKEGEPLTFASGSDKLAHTLQRARDWMLERNAHLGSATLLRDIEDALAEHTGTEPSGPLSSFAPGSSKPSSGGSAEPSTSTAPNLAVP